MNMTLKGYRTMLGLSQAQMGEKIGMSNTSYSKREAGDRQFKQSEMQNITTIIKAKFPEATMEIIFKKE